MKLNRAYSLVEILVVMGIMGTLMALSTPALVGAFRGNSFQANISQFASMLEQARQTAASENTYVWVAMAEVVDENGLPSVEAVLVTSKDGTDCVGWTGEPIDLLESGRVAIHGKPWKFPALELVEAGTFTAPQIQRLSGAPPATKQMALAEGLTNFELSGSSPRKYTHSLRFSPRGNAANGTAVIPFVELGISPKPDGGQAASNIAVLRIHGLTGMLAIYRP